MIDFGRIPIKHTIEGDLVYVDIRKKLGNRIHQTTGDIGFDDFAHQVYFSEGELEVPAEYVEPLKAIIKEHYLASVQKSFNELLTAKED